jgi:prevent-host-death family protein
MTRMTTIHRQGHDRGAWAVAEAKARFSEVIDRALADGPQTITRKGQKAVVVVSAEEWDEAGDFAAEMRSGLKASPAPLDRDSRSSCKLRASMSRSTRPSGPQGSLCHAVVYRNELRLRRGL